LPPLNLYDLYGLDCYDQSLRQTQSKCESSGDIDKDKFNPVTFYSYMEDTGRTLNKLRIFSPAS
jgi:hypothetical protein